MFGWEMFGWFKNQKKENQKKENLMADYQNLINSPVWTTATATTTGTTTGTGYQVTWQPNTITVSPQQFQQLQQIGSYTWNGYGTGTVTGTAVLGNSVVLGEAFYSPVDLNIPVPEKKGLDSIIDQEVKRLRG